MKKRHLLLLATMLSLPICNSYAANVEEDANLAEELTALSLFDWTETYLTKQLSEAKGPDQDLYKVSMATLYYRIKKEKEAAKLISEISLSSPFYDRAQKVAGISAYNAGAYDDAAKMFENYLKGVLERHKKAAPTVEEIKVFEKDLPYLITIYKECKPNHDALVKVMRAQASLRQQLQKQWFKDNPDRDQSELPDEANAEDIQLYICKFSLDIYEKEKKEKGKVDVPKVEMLLKDLEILFWKDAYIRTLAAAQAMRAYTLLDKFAKAEEIKKTYEPSAEESDAVYTDENRAISPRGSFRYYSGNIYLMQANNKKNPEKQAQLLQKALSVFYACAKYHFRFELGDNLVSSIDDASKMFNDLGKTLPSILTDANPEIARWYVRDAVTTEARRFFNEKKYNEAIPELLKGYSNSPTSDLAKDALYMLFNAYSKVDPIMIQESLIVAKTMGSRYPKSDMTAAVYLTAGTLAANAAKGLPEDNPEKTVLDDESMIMYSEFLTMFPTHENAPQLAYKLAHDYYKSAQNLMRQGNQLKGTERADLFAKGREAYLLAAEKFKLVIDKFAQKKNYVTESWYFLGMCYNSALEFEKSIPALEKFISLEKKDYNRLSNAQYTISLAYYDMAESVYNKCKEAELKASEYSDIPVELAKEIGALRVESKKDYIKAADAFTYYTGEFANKVLKNQTDAIKERLSAAKIMIAWSLDGANEKAKAINAFKAFIESKKAEAIEKKENPKAYSRMAILYTELKDVSNAAIALKTLNEQYPNSPEAKDARFILGRSMYNIENYPEAIAAFKDMLDNTKDLNVPALQFVARNMIAYKSSTKDVTPDMAFMAVRAGEKLLEAIEKPRLTDWVSKAQAKSLGNGKSATSKAKIDETLYPIKESIWMNLAKAYTLADDGKNGMAKKGVETYTNLILPPKTKNAKQGEAKYTSPYFFDALSERGAAYAKAGNAALGHKDLNDLQTLVSNIDRYDLLRKAIVKDADIYIAAKDYKGAQRILQNFFLAQKINEKPSPFIPIDATKPQADKIRELADKRFEEQLKWIEEGAYKYIYCSAKLGDKAAIDAAMSKYKDAFPKGKFKTELNNLPQPEGANKP